MGWLGELPVTAGEIVWVDVGIDLVFSSVLYVHERQLPCAVIGL